MVSKQNNTSSNSEPDQDEPPAAALPKGHWIHEAVEDAKMAHAAKALAQAGAKGYQTPGRASTAPDQGESKDQFGRRIPPNVGDSEPDMEPDDRMFLGKPSR
jgi:hypothetical protein